MRFNKMVRLLVCCTTAILLIAGQLHQVHGDELEETDDDNLLTKIKCKVGDKYEYMMATQSSLLEQADANLLIKTKFELKCLDKKMWLNETSGELKNGQLFEGRITSVTPLHLAANAAETVTIKSGKIQMAALFASLEKIPTESTQNSTSGKQPNLKVGAVNEFFANFTKSFGELISQLFRKLVQFFENLLKRNKSNVRTTSGLSWKCSNGKTVQGRAAASRQKRQSFKSINFAQFGDDLNDLFRHPFSFIQLEDGSVVNVQISPAETNPAIGHFKRFIAGSFATQLDQRKKAVLESSTLGEHLSHYQIEYDEPDRSKVTPEQYMAGAVKRSRRATSSKDTSSQPVTHLVSVVRMVRREDMITASGGQERNQLRHKTMKLADVDFNAQQVQLIEGNMLVASGGYFHSVLPVDLQKAGAGRERKIRAAETTNKSESFDEVLGKYMTMNLEYSMVRVTKNRWRRSVNDDNSQAPVQLSNRAISTYIASMKMAAANVTSNLQLARQKRAAAAESAESSAVDNNVICTVVPSKDGLNNQIVRDNVEVKDQIDAEPVKECYEYKEFGSGWLKAFYNRSITTSSSKTRRGKSLENFATKYRLGAQMLGENMFMGQIDISRTDDASKLRINLFGSEYIDLNLCDIRDKTFSQADQIPLFAENIWFMTNVGVNIKYDLQFKVKVPEAVCQSTEKDTASSNNNSIILARMMADQFNLNQNTKVELGGEFDATFLIFNGQMKLNGNFDMDSDLDFSSSCISGRSIVRPMACDVSLNYKFFHPLCGEWQADSWAPKQLSWRLNKPYRNSWFDNVCV